MKDHKCSGKEAKQQNYPWSLPDRDFKATAGKYCCFKENMKKYIDERLPEEYEKCLVGLNAITRKTWNTSQQTEDKREKIHTCIVID